MASENGICQECKKEFKESTIHLVLQPHIGPKRGKLKFGDEPPLFFCDHRCLEAFCRRDKPPYFDSEYLNDYYG